MKVVVGAALTYSGYEKRLPDAACATPDNP